MEIILLEDVPHVGNMGDVVRVRPGYGRNHLIPTGLATIASRGKKKELEHQLRVINEKRERLRDAAQVVGDALNDFSITITRRAGEGGRLFGSVTNRDIHDALLEAGHEVERRRIVLGEPIKGLGIYKVPVKLHADVEANVLVWVAAQ